MTGGLLGLLSGLACDCPGQCIILGRELIVCPIDCGDAVTDLFLIIVGPLHLVILLGAGLLTGPIKIVSNEREDRDARDSANEAGPPKFEFSIGIHNDECCHRPNDADEP